MSWPDSQPSCLRILVKVIRWTVQRESQRCYCVRRWIRNIENPFSLCSDFAWRNWLPFVDRPVMHVSCMLFHLGGISTRTFIKVERVRGRTDAAGRVCEWPQCALESLVPMRAQVWLALNCCNTVCHAVSPAGRPWQGAASLRSSAFMATRV